MKIKQLLGMMALDANANEVGKIDDAEFDPQEGKITAITIVLKINKEAAIEEAEKAKEAKEEVEEVEAEIVDDEAEAEEETEEAAEVEID